MITTLFLLLNIVFGSEVQALGSPNFAVRHSKQLQLQNTIKGMIVYQLGKDSEDAEIRFRCRLLKSSDRKFLKAIEYKAAVFLACNDSAVNRQEALLWVDNREVLKDVAVKLGMWMKDAPPYWKTHDISHHQAVVYFTQTVRWYIKSAKIWKSLDHWITTTAITYTSNLTEDY